MTRKVIKKAIENPVVPSWDDYDTIEGRFVGWLCCIFLLGFTVFIGPFYVILGEHLDKHVSNILLEFEEITGIGGLR